jgi:hypothetical protein
VGFLVDGVALGQILSEYFGFPAFSILIIIIIIIYHPELLK